MLINYVDSLNVWGLRPQTPPLTMSGDLLKIKIHPQQKAIIVSGFSESDRVHEAQALGAGAYVKKPYVINKLGLATRNELKKQR